MTRRLLAVVPFAVFAVALLSSRLVDGVLSVLLPITIVVLSPLILITVLASPSKRAPVAAPWWRESTPTTSLGAGQTDAA